MTYIIESGRFSLDSRFLLTLDEKRSRSFVNSELKLQKTDPMNFKIITRSYHSQLYYKIFHKKSCKQMAIKIKISKGSLA